MSRSFGPGADQIVTGARYVEQMTAVQSDRLARAAFRDLVLKVMPPGAALFDFGCGTGMDARFYAERGVKVSAYDVDPRMCEFFAEHCRDLIETGRVTLERGNYPDFLAHGDVGGRGVDLVTANFAPLNLIDNLRPLFAKFHARTGPGGQVLASVLSPYFLGDMRYGWWWRNSLRLWRAGHYSVPGLQAPIVRRRLADFAAQAAPYFLLERVFRGLPAAGAREVTGMDPSRAGLTAGLRVSTCRFMFLLFARRHSGAAGGHGNGGLRIRS